MNTDLLDFQRQQAILWLSNRLREEKSASDVDKALDRLIRETANLQQGSLYGFVRVPEKPKGKILLSSIPFWHQLDNKRMPHRTCFSSTCAMQGSHYTDKITGDDMYLNEVLKHGDTTEPHAQIAALKFFDLKPTYRQNMDFEDLDENLESGHPVAIGFLHRGTPQTPHGGHWALVVGRTQDNDAYIVNDPYGCIPYTGPVEDGHHVEYSKTMLRNRWLVEGSKSGWGMTVRGGNCNNFQ